MNRITKLILFAAMALLSCAWAQAQTPTNYLHYAGRGDYSINGRQLSEEEVFQLIGEKVYYETYLGAQKQRRIGLPLGIVGASVLGVTTAWYCIAIDAPWIHESTVVATSSIGWALGGLASAGLAFYFIGTSRLKWIAKDYNLRNGYAAVWQFGATPNGIGIRVQF